MPSALTYPGVYCEELSSGVRTLTGVATSVAAFVDFFREGPVNKAVQIQSLSDFEREFGGLDKRSEASYAILQFFMNGGSEAWVVRANKDAVKASVVIKDKTGEAEILEVSARNEGEWGNTLRVDIDHLPMDSEHFNLTVTRYDGADGQSQAVQTEKFLNLSIKKTETRYVERVVNNESRLISIKHNTPDTTNLPAATGTLSGDLSKLTQTDFDNISDKALTFIIGDSHKKVELKWAKNDVKNLGDLCDRLQSAIRKADPNSGLFTGTTVEVVVGEEVATGRSKQLRIRVGRSDKKYDPAEVVKITNFANDNTATILKLVKTQTADTASYNVQEYQLGTEKHGDFLKKGDQGNDGDTPGADELTGLEAETKDEGIYALRKVDIFNLLCLPGVMKEDSKDQRSSILSKALKFCEERRAFLILDVPEGVNSVQAVKDWVAANDSLRHKNCAIYFPRVNIPDPLDEYRLRTVGASGTMAGLYSRSDSARGVWKAPAGTEASLNGVSELEVKLTDPQNGTLNPLAINCLRNFPVYGNVAWGARTLRGADNLADEYKYVPVRRLALFIEESLFRGTKWIVFEPNDESLWAQIRLNIGSFMHSLFRQGAFQGTTPSQAYFVKCDKETTTQDDINRGIVNIIVGFAPLKPAEFVVIKLQQMAGDIQT